MVNTVIDCHGLAADNHKNKNNYNLQSKEEQDRLKAMITALEAEFPLVQMLRPACLTLAVKRGC